MSETLSVIVHKTIETNPLSVSSEIVASVTMPPCAQEGEEDTEDDTESSACERTTPWLTVVESFLKINL